MANARILFGGDENHEKPRFRVFRNDERAYLYQSI